MKKKIEVEVKYYLSERPQGLSDSNGTEVVQYYLDLQKTDVQHFAQVILTVSPNDIRQYSEARVRSSNCNGERIYTFTLKGPGTLERAEIETEISAVFFNKWSKQAIGRVEKTRYAILLENGKDSFNGELDVYHANLKGLCSLEVEFNSQIVDQKRIDAAVKKSFPKAKDVTHDQYFKNATLSKLKSWQKPK